MRVVPAVFAILLAAARCAAATSPPPAPAQAVPSVRGPMDLGAVLTKGINFYQIFEPYRDSSVAYGDEDLRRMASHLHEEDFARVSAMGFTHIRLGLGMTFLQDSRPPFPLRPDVLALMDRALDMAEKHHLAVILDMHQTPVPDLVGDSAQMQAFRTMWRALAARYASREQPLLFELLNEPRVEDSAVWRDITRRLIADIREVDPNRVIVVTGGGWGGAEDLIALGNLHLPNLVYAFHFYEPHVFTHQGETSAVPTVARLRGIRYPIDPKQMRLGQERAIRENLETWPFDAWINGGGKEELRASLQPVFDFGEREGLVLWCGEFGVNKIYARPADVTRWFTDVVGLLDEHHVGWSMFVYHSEGDLPEYQGMDLIEEDGRPSSSIVESLGLRMPPP